MEAKNGKGCTSSSAKVLGFRRNPAKPLKKLKGKVRKLFRNRSFDGSIVAAAKSKLAELKRAVKKAEYLLEEASQRKGDGKLNDTTFEAETLAPKAIIELFEILEQTLEKAAAAKDAYAVECVDNAAQILLGRIGSGSLLRKVAYPKGDMQTPFVKERYSTVGEAYGAVVEALDSSHAKYDLKIPELA